VGGRFATFRSTNIANCKDDMNGNVLPCANISNGTAGSYGRWMEVWFMMEQQKMRNNTNLTTNS
jgi:hypothetical protein